MRSMLMAGLLLGIAGPGLAHAANVVVNSTLDTADAANDGVCDDGAGNCTLRAAIMEVNRDPAGGTISFNIPGGGIKVIKTSGPGYITQPVLIDGRTQPGYAGSPLIEIDGQGTATVGFGCIPASSISPRPTCSFAGLAIHSFPTFSIRYTSGTSGKVFANYIGLTAAGVKAPSPNSFGIFATSTTTAPITIGGLTAADGNVISGNTFGISVSGDGIRISNNLIGPNPAGTASIDPNQRGITMDPGTGNFIENNLISGNLVGISFGSNCSFNSSGFTVQNNRIGTDAAGTAAVGNGTGISLTCGRNTIQGNTISGNTTAGITLSGSLATGNVIVNNFIGTGANGTGAVGNAVGVLATSSSASNTLGGTMTGQRNIISGNTVGVSVTGGAGLNIVGNVIGLDVNGAVLGNTSFGIDLAASSVSTIGGTMQAATRNIISGNGVAGVHVASDVGFTSVRILGNFIGTTIDGLSSRPNGVGIQLDGTTNTIVGTATDGNLISGNSGAGIAFLSDASRNTVAGNIIGANAAGTALGNLQGILINSTGNLNVIGGSAGNQIRFNTQAGIAAVAGSDNRFQANSIGLNSGLGIDLGPAGVTNNDNNDADSGPNGLQNFPVLTLASSDGINSWFTGTLNTGSSQSYVLEFFSSASCDPSGHGPGETYLGSANFSSAAFGNNIPFVVRLPGATASKVATVTAYQVGGGTSEFSACQPIKDCPVITVSPTTLPVATQGSPYSQSLTAAGGAGSYTFAITSGSLPPGLTLSSSGVLSGTPLVGGNFTFTATATDANGCKGARDYTLSVCGITVLPATLPNGNTQSAYNAQVAATGGTPAFTFSVSAGSLPPGLSMSSSGTFTGTPSMNGTYVFTVTAMDSASCSGSRAYTVQIADCAGLSLNPPQLPAAVLNQPYDQAIDGAGGTAPYSLSITSGMLPAGLMFSAGRLTGTPTMSELASFVVKATDQNSCSVSQSYSLAVVCPNFNVTPAALPGGTIDTSYSAILGAMGGAMPYTFAVTSGSLPDGLMLSDSGSLAGTPTRAGDFPFAVTVTGGDGCIGQQFYVLPIQDPSNGNGGAGPGGTAPAGCGCRVIGSSSSDGMGILGGCLLALGLCWRRRRSLRLSSTL